MTQPKTIAIAPSISDYFQNVIEQALRSRKVDATHAAMRYVVGILCDFVHPTEEVGSTLSRPLVFLFREAMDAPGAERFRRLRTLGDGVLYVLGFFGGHTELRGLDRSYAIAVGTTAYDRASAMLNLGQSNQGPDVLSELSRKFERFVEVLSDVADETIARGTRDQRDLVKIYERWVRTGSAKLGVELANMGIMPTRGTSGLN